MASRDLGCRIDCLKELLAYHKLPDGKGGLQTPLEPRADWGPDPRLRVLRKAVDLLNDADELLSVGSYDAVVEKCDAALALAPQYTGALLQRSKAYLFRLAGNWAGITAERRLAYIDRALEDSNRCLEMGATWTEAALTRAHIMVYAGRLRSNPKALRDAICMIDALLARARPLPSPTVAEQADAFYIRALAHEFLGQAKQSETDYSLSIRLAPMEPDRYRARAAFLERSGRWYDAALDQLMASALENWLNPTR